MNTTTRTLTEREIKILEDARDLLRELTFGFDDEKYDELDAPIELFEEIAMYVANTF